MADTGWVGPGTGSADVPEAATFVWNSPTNIQVNDTAEANSAKHSKSTRDIGRMVCKTI